MASWLPSLPVNLVDSVHPDPTPEFRAWVNDLPHTVADLADSWSLQLGPPYQPGGRYAWVAPVRTSTGRELVLKVAWRHDEAVHEADGLRVWDGKGAVRLYASVVCGATNALLLEWCTPGIPLAVSRPEPDQDMIVAGLLRQLWTAPVDSFPFRSLQTMCEQWAAEFEGRHGATGQTLDPGLAWVGMELFRSLPATADRQVLRCTDLHAGRSTSPSCGRSPPAWPPPSIPHRGPDRVGSETVPRASAGCVNPRGCCPQQAAVEGEPREGQSAMDKVPGRWRAAHVAPHRSVPGRTGVVAVPALRTGILPR